MIVVIVIIIIVLVLLVGRKDEVGGIDVTKTDFEYDVKVCDEYFELIECIIDRDTDDRFTRQMRIDLKNEIKNVQEKWKELDEHDLNKRCSDELLNYKNLLKVKDVETFGCIVE